MLASGRRALHLKKSSRPSTWICRRCFHAQIRGINQQQTEQASDTTTRTAGVDRLLSPIEAFMNKYAKGRNQDQIQQPSHKIIDETEVANHRHRRRRRVPPLSEIAKAYRENAPPKLVEEDEEVGRSRQVYEELIRLDEISDAGGNEIFDGEYMREDYQGAIALHGTEYIQKKFPFKQGDVVETRSYFCLLA